MKQRVDHLLALRGLAESRARAQALMLVGLDIPGWLQCMTRGPKSWSRLLCRKVSEFFTL